MKTYTIDIHPQLTEVTFSVKNGAAFERAAIKGEYSRFAIDVCKEDRDRVRQFAVKYGNDKCAYSGNWHAHCNGFAMDLLVTNHGNDFEINTWRPFGCAKK